MAGWGIAVWMLTVISLVLFGFRWFLKPMAAFLLIRASVTSFFMDTLGIVIDREAGELTIVDLKTGFRGVDPENNTQLMTYALGALAKLIGDATPAPEPVEAPSDDDLF